MNTKLRREIRREIEINNRLTPEFLIKRDLVVVEDNTRTTIYRKGNVVIEFFTGGLVW